MRNAVLSKIWQDLVQFKLICLKQTTGEINLFVHLLAFNLV
jgi:hypothetical protein